MKKAAASAAIIMSILMLLVIVHQAKADDDHEDEREEHEHDDDYYWDFSDDFQDFEVQYIEPAANVQDAAVQDTDQDGIPDALDQYPGKNDYLYTDADGDGVVDAQDVYPGVNDQTLSALLQDTAQQEPVAQTTPQQAVPPTPSWWMRLLGWLGFVKLD